MPICFLRRSSRASRLVSQPGPSPGVDRVTSQAKRKSTYCSACVWLMERVGQTLCNQGRGPIGFGRVHLAACKTVSCRQGRAADGQFASDFQAGAKPFRSFGSRVPSGSSFDVLQMAVRPLRLCVPTGPGLAFRQRSLWPGHSGLVSQGRGALDSSRDAPAVSTSTWTVAKKC